MRSRFTSYLKSRDRHDKKWWFLLLMPFLIYGVIYLTYWLWYVCYPMSEEEKKASDITLVTNTRYVLYADDEEVFGFTSTRGDTLLMGVGETVTDTVAAQRVKRWTLLPYSGNSVAVELPDSGTTPHLSSEKVSRLLKEEMAYLDRSLVIAKEQKADVDYYLRTHTVMDNGFDIVARYEKFLKHTTDSFSTLRNNLEKIIQHKKFHIRMERRYFQTTEKGMVECDLIDADEVVLVKSNIGASFSPFTRQLTYGTCLERLQARRIKPQHKAFSTYIDSLGLYTGERDSVDAPHGYGRMQASNGSFYEGEWEHGKRSGVGFSMEPGKRLQMGEWKNDNFLGERIEYTPDRVYGIDISRYQHEKEVVVRKGRRVRKKMIYFPINWANLRITHLGKQSKKTIRGEVNYPVRFIFIKATEGVAILNKYYLSDYANARKYGYRTGAYHFYSIYTSGARQAEHFLKNSRYTKGDLPPVLDIEPTDELIKKAGGIQRIFTEVRSWLNIVEKQRGVKPILYVSQRFVNKYLPLAPDLKKNYDVWIARYGEYKPDVNMVYWQLSQDGRVNGIQTDVDINVFNGFDF